MGTHGRVSIGNEGLVVHNNKQGCHARRSPIGGAARS
jgi:hypothetical protein